MLAGGTRWVILNFSEILFGKIDTPTIPWKTDLDRYSFSVFPADVMRVTERRRRFFSLYQTNAFGFQRASEDDPISPRVRLASRVGFLTSRTL